MTIASPYHATILLVEDYPAALLVSTLIIEDLGYTVVTASCGKEAIDYVRESTEPFLVILMDVQMQDMDGFEVTRVIRGLEKDKGFTNTIIAVTAHALAGDRERCLEGGMNDYISKPIHPDILAQKLATITQARQKKAV